MPVPQPGHASRALLGVGVLVAVVLGLHLLGPAALAPPDLTDPSSWLDWAGSRSPTLAAMALVRLVAIALAWYLLAVTVLQVLVGLTDSPALATAMRLVTTSASRHVATAVLGAGVLAATPMVTTSSLTAMAATAPLGIDRVTSPASIPGSIPGSTPGPAPGPGTRAVATPDTTSTRAPRLERVEAPRLSRLEPSDQPDTPGPDETGTPITEEIPEPTPAPTPGAADDAVADDTDGEADEQAVDEGTWTVVAGDHFWGVAEREVTRGLGRTPTEREVATWWLELVEVNTDRLVDPGNPDLILPGQVMRWPDTPVRGHG